MGDSMNMITFTSGILSQTFLRSCMRRIISKSEQMAIAIKEMEKFSIHFNKTAHDWIRARISDDFSMVNNVEICWKLSERFKI